MKLAFVTHYCPHYRTKAFETLAEQVDTDFYFYSSGGEWYWQRQHGMQVGDFNYKYLPGFEVAGTRITPTLVSDLLSKPYDAYLKCINGRFALPATYMAARIKKRPFILWTGIWMRLNSRGHRLMYPLTRHIYMNADAIVTKGTHVKRFLMGEGVPAERIFATKNAIHNEPYARPVADDVKAELRARLNVRPDQKVVLSLSRLVHEKGVDTLVQAFAALKEPNSVLVIAGSGPEEAKLKAMIAERGIGDQVRFAGYVPNQESTHYYAISDVFVVPSITTHLFKEPWGIVVNEALNQGTPVIASDAVGAAAGELVRNGENGFMIPEQDSAALAVALKTILGDAELRERMSANAKALMQTWTIDSMITTFRQGIDYAMKRNREVALP